MRTTALAAALTLFLGCIPVTVNLTFAFPAKEMEQKLVDMERKVREEGEKEKPKSNAVAFDPVPTVATPCVLAGFGAQDLTVETPAIKEINARRAKRVNDLNAHFDAGRIGEGKDAFLAERETGDLGGKEKAALRRLIKEENEDRNGLLKEILKGNKLPDDQFDEVQHLYARARMKEAKLGWWLESPKDTWVKKTEEHQKRLDKGQAIEE